MSRLKEGDFFVFIFLLLLLVVKVEVVVRGRVSSVNETVLCFLLRHVFWQ